MVTGVSSVSSFDPIAYLNQIKGVAPVAPTTPVKPPANSDSSTPASSTPATSSSTSTSSSPSLSNLLGLSPDVLSLLQGIASGSDNSAVVSSLYNSSAINSTPDPLAGVYSTLLYNASSAAPIAQAVQATQQQAANTAATSNPVASLLAANNTASNAYNKTLLQNAQATAAANDYQANGTKLVA